MLTLTPIFAQPPDDLKLNFDEAERRIVRLPPTAFPELPGNVIQELQRRGCPIPQTAYTKKPHNVIKGVPADFRHLHNPGKSHPTLKHCEQKLCR